MVYNALSCDRDEAITLLIFLVFLWKHFRKSVFDLSIYIIYLQNRGRLIKTKFSKTNISKFTSTFPGNGAKKLIELDCNTIYFNYSIVVSSRNPQRNTDNPRSYPNESWMEFRIIDSENVSWKVVQSDIDEITLMI